MDEHKAAGGGQPTPTDAPRPDLLKGPGAIAVLMPVWGFFGLGWACLSGLIAVALHVAIGGDLSNPVLPAGINAAATAIQLAGFAGIAAVLAFANRVPFERAFALRKPAPILLLIGFVGGMTVGFFPGWIAEQLELLRPEWMPSTLEMIRDALLTSSFNDKLAMTAAVTLAAPLFEELLFRGWLWDLIEENGNWVLAWVATSVLFGMMHIDPVQGTAVMFTGFFLGWLRHVSGSIWPCVACHFMNNALASIFTMSIEVESTVSLPFWAVALATLFTLGLAGVGFKFRSEGDPGRD